LSPERSEVQEDPTGQTLSINIDVINGSDGMIQDVEIRIPGSEQVRRLHFIPPGQTMSRRFDYLEPDYYLMNVGCCGGPSSTYELRVDLEFTDSTGRRWSRGGWDSPVRIISDAKHE
jgi:hypothetical protein